MAMFRVKICRSIKVCRRHWILFFFVFFVYLFILTRWNAIGSFKTLGNNGLGIYQWVRFTDPPVSRRSGVNVILIASWRSGSSFTGQLFNMHEDIFYLFEPLKFLGNERVQQDETSKALDMMYNCDFHHNDMTDWIKLTNNDILHRVSSNALIELCPKNITQGASAGSCPRRIFKKCPDLTAEDITRACKSYLHKFFKVIKLTDITFLEELVTKHNVKVIHLVRDPRGIHFSRQNSYDERYSMTKKLFGLYWTCQHVNEIIKLLEKSPQWLLGNYKRVRFEDLSLKPLETAKEMYEFLKIPFTQKIHRWIFENTSRNNTNRTTTTGTSTKKCNHLNHKLAKKSSDIAHAWRMDASLSTVLEIQETCTKAMQLLGYLNVHTEEQLRDKDYAVMAK